MRIPLPGRPDRRGDSRAQTGPHDTPDPEHGASPTTDPARKPAADREPDAPRTAKGFIEEELLANDDTVVLPPANDDTGLLPPVIEAGAAGAAAPAGDSGGSRSRVSDDTVVMPPVAGEAGGLPSIPVGGAVPPTRAGGALPPAPATAGAGLPPSLSGVSLGPGSAGSQRPVDYETAFLPPVSSGTPAGGGRPAGGNTPAAVVGAAGETPAAAAQGQPAPVHQHRWFPFGRHKDQDQEPTGARRGAQPWYGDGDTTLMPPVAPNPAWEANEVKTDLFGPSKAGELVATEITAWFGNHKVLDRVSLTMAAGEVTALIGPSGCGKSTFLRILNRMHELVPSATLAGEVRLDGVDVYDRNERVTAARRQIGMIFQKPNPFPAKSIYDNVVAGLSLMGVRASREEKDILVEDSLRKAALWDEVKDRLEAPGGGLSGGQQQRLCIARSLAVSPHVLLMDEPCSALDPTSTRRVEETVEALRGQVTVVIVTHNMQQALRISRQCAFFLASQGEPGQIVEYGDTSAMFDHPKDQRTHDYVNGRFG